MISEEGLAHALISEGVLVYALICEETHALMLWSCGTQKKGQTGNPYSSSQV